MKKLLSMFSGLLALTAVTKAAEPNVKVIPKSCPHKTYFKGFFMGVKLGGSYNHITGTGKKFGDIKAKMTNPSLEITDKSSKILTKFLPNLSASMGYSFAASNNVRIGLETDIPFLAPLVRVGYVTGKHHIYGGAGYNLWMHGITWLADYSSTDHEGLKMHKLESDGFTNWFFRLGYDYAINEHSAFGAYITYGQMSMKSGDATMAENPFIKRHLTNKELEDEDILPTKATNHQVAVNLTYTRYF